MHYVTDLVFTFFTDTPVHFLDELSIPFYIIWYFFASSVYLAIVIQHLPDVYFDLRGDEANSPRNGLGLSDIYDDTRYEDGKAVKKKRYHIQRKWHARDFVEFQDFSVLGGGVGGGWGEEYSWKE